MMRQETKAMVAGVALVPVLWVCAIIIMSL